MSDDAQIEATDLIERAESLDGMSAPELRWLVRSLRARVIELQQQVTGYQDEQQRLAKKWRAKLAAAQAVSAAHARGESVSCNCPVGQCQKGPTAATERCWVGWHSRQLAQRMREFRASKPPL